MGKLTRIKFVLLLSLFLFNFSELTGQNIIKWMTWEEALEAHKQEPKKLVVDIYTNWCTWCKKMDKATFQKDHIAKFVNKNFYPVKFNAETKSDIVFNGESYQFIRNGRRGYHELALKITQGKLSYPTVVFLDEELNIIQPIPGFQDPTNFELIMTYFAGDFYKTTPWASYTRSYRSNLRVQPVRGN